MRRVLLAGDLFQQQLDRHQADFLHGLGDAGDAGRHVIEQQVVVEGDERNVFRDTAAGLRDGLDGAEEDLVAEGDDRSRTGWIAQEKVGLDISVLDGEPVPGDVDLGDGRSCSQGTSQAQEFFLEPA